MTISPVSLAGIEQTIAELQSASASASASDPATGSDGADQVDGSQGSDDFASTLAQATGTSTMGNLFAEALAAGADPSADGISAPGVDSTGSSSSPEQELLAVLLGAGGGAGGVSSLGDG